MLLASLHFCEYTFHTTILNNKKLTFTRSAGYPLITYFTKNDALTFGAFNIGGTNASGQIPMMTGNWGLIDKDTPKDAYTYPSHQYNQEDWQLVYSDEFNVAGRTFYPGDDPFWEAVDLHYWGVSYVSFAAQPTWLTCSGDRRTTWSGTPPRRLPRKMVS